MSEQRIRVLVVDDSATVRSVICRELGADPAIEVIGYGRDGVEALERIRESKPDAITEAASRCVVHGMPRCSV